MQNNDIMEIASVISGIISLVTLIVFFIMASNISAIRKILEIKPENNINHSAVLEEIERPFLPTYRGKHFTEVQKEGENIISALLDGKPADKDAIGWLNKQLKNG
jgi:hypothetical protein